MTDFWVTSGYHLLDITDDGRLAVTSQYANAYWQRPEVAPVAESCKAERVLHARLTKDPFLTVTDTDLTAFKDTDAAENYRIVADFVAGLKQAETLERYYASLFAGGGISIPPLFIDQIAHALMRHVLRDVTNPLQVRAGEMFFRKQRVTVNEGQVLVADDEIVEMYSDTGGFGSLGKLLVEGNAALREVELDVLTEENADMYWPRSDRFDTVLDLTFARPGLDALCRVMEMWIGQFCGLDVRIHPVQSIRDEKWRWHIGLDTESTAILNDLYNGIDVDAARQENLISLFRMEAKDAGSLIPEMRGKPIYLGLAKTVANTLIVKPQNLLTNLPLSIAA